MKRREGNGIRPWEKIAFGVAIAVALLIALITVLAYVGVDTPPPAK
ncbi:hypothetical protein SRB5_39340 [Streptomyces sp. RB5]|uniref:Uncharacterized protein n=1 Tax=Streptomyces smaragdinus TaxID=2585196 RepID=A0A7K0CJW3_9ACTN|nr:hypothetical protein [Streptomyces smaragdinus]MQY13780.1 hypothetical protein [Streptomyces smaragdinus]